MTRTDAKSLITELVWAEVAVTKQVYSRYGGPTKTALRREKMAITKLFKELTGVAPDADELNSMCGG